MDFVLKKYGKGGGKMVFGLSVVGAIAVTLVGLLVLAGFSYVLLKICELDDAFESGIVKTLARTNSLMFVVIFLLRMGEKMVKKILTETLEQPLRSILVIEISTAVIIVSILMMIINISMVIVYYNRKNNDLI